MSEPQAFVMDEAEWEQGMRSILSSPAHFAASGCGLVFRSYQRAVAEAVTNSVLKAQGREIVVIFPRQSGKNELQAHIEAYLLTVLSQFDVELVKVSPTWKPQSLNAMRRLERVLRNNLFTCSLNWHKEQGYIYRLGRARLSFLSGSPASNVVGATASALLQCDEAQDVGAEKWDKEFNPMAASTNATRVYWGTAWTSQTLLAREKRLAQAAQASDGLPRLFETDADAVRREVPAYGRFVDGEVRKLGQRHPFVLTQFYSQEIDAQGGMFPPERLALMHGQHPAQSQPRPGALYAFLVDVGGQDENASAEPLSSLGNPSAASTHNASALTIVEVDLSALDDLLVEAPRYCVVGRQLWFGLRHSEQYARLKALADCWQPARIVIDATGLGEGLASFLARALDGNAPSSASQPRRVVPFKFSQASKSELGWRFIAAIESGRFKDHRVEPDDTAASALQALFFEQARAAQMDVLPGPNRLLRWGVPDGKRRPVSGAPLNDDLLLSAALVCILDGERWGRGESAIVAADPLAGLQPVY